ncbi:MAG: adenylate/guanylate cyclase domain-containing protein [Ignavibacteria bacterium]|nr:adenylate/guanylate cyclase domain-containing protein [Ignavibacteria bacterium]MBT8380924.1 adenylate/guanylate cyclase domain-containing protein [Ignavibacteria bacterium]MBT8391482.1 adenylate/guanylate cyclase domain-containing protein [Ignavibacteria bacterium]NNJ54145.1 adenylate/guanylate cyclase domain-containing protein [Ignavibacteriaceae bacterium]NNL20652.1 adenylate/guanylate cyclase domain-containing protein [Ignavibacteriaceae bacterium]
MSINSDFSLHKWLEKSNGLVCLVFTDLVGSTSLLSEVGTVLYTDYRKAHLNRANQLRRKFGGILIDQTGDSLFIAFRSVMKSYAFAVGLFDNPGNINIKVRIGIHYGNVSADGSALAGRAVHYAARVMQQGKDAELWMSDSARNSLFHESPGLAESIKWNNTDECEFKGFEGKQRLWCVA